MGINIREVAEKMVDGFNATKIVITDSQMDGVEKEVRVFDKALNEELMLCPTNEDSVALVAEILEKIKGEWAEENKPGERRYKLIQESKSLVITEKLEME